MFMLGKFDFDLALKFIEYFLLNLPKSKSEDAFLMYSEVRSSSTCTFINFWYFLYLYDLISHGMFIDFIGL